MGDQLVTVEVLGRFQQALFVQLEGLENRLAVRIDAQIQAIESRLTALESEG